MISEEYRQMLMEDAHTYALQEEESLDASRQGVVYIAGPMTGYRDFNYPAFDRAARFLQSEGWDNIINPADNFARYQGLAKSTYLRQAVRQVASCDAILFLPNWGASNGAYLEFQIALALGLRLLFIRDFIPDFQNETYDPAAQVVP